MNTWAERQPRALGRFVSSPAVVRFWPKVDRRGPDRCWPWRPTAAAGTYGKFWTGSRLVWAHRFAYELIVGPIPEGLQLDHLCRNRNCVNAAHLEPVTNKINCLRGTGFAAENHRKTQCPQGHKYVPANTYRNALGWRECRACKVAKQAAYRVAKRQTVAQTLAKRSGH